MDVWEAIAKRRSVRRYRADDIPPKAVQRILEAAVSAPSAGNKQPWHFWVVRNAGVKQALCEAAWNQRFIAEAPVVIVICVEPERSASTYGNRGRELYCLQDAAAATMNILLAATALGLGSCWVGAFSEAAVARALDLPASMRPVALVPLGCCLDEGEARRTTRRSLSEVTSTID